MNRTSNMSISGELKARKVGPPMAPLAWRIKNAARPSYIFGALASKAARAFSGAARVPVITSELRARVYHDGKWVDYGVLSRRVVTDAGLAYLAADYNASANHVALFNYHGVGVGTTAEAAGDTALVTESTTILNPDSTRATGVKSNPTGPQYRTVGTVTFDGVGAITEHGIFSQAATGGGTLWDRSVFSAINVISGDSIVFTYTVTFTGS